MAAPCDCTKRTGGCNKPTNLCTCKHCDCALTLKDRQHEITRIQQFESKARDDAHFRQLILNRATKCGTEKRTRFIAMLKRIGRTDLASFIEMTMKEREEK